MTLTVTDYLDVVSSWCFWSEPTWAELKRRYDGRVQFQWKIALMDPTGLPTSREQEQWFYRRSGMMMRSIHAQHGVVRSKSPGVARPELRGRSRERFWFH